MGLSKTLGIKYGNASIMVSVIVLIIDIIMREPLGIGMLLDAFLVGKFVDLLNWIDFIPYQDKWYIQVPMILVGLFIMGFSQFLYMKGALCCGPRDTMLVGFARRLKKIPIGIVGVLIHIVVTTIGYLLGGPVGIGTLLCMALTGPFMQLAFRVVKFDATGIEHQNLIDSFRVLGSRSLL
ncbi:MAG: hypothetical protein MJ115_01140 [Clostridia bacterium]|nr:hypothetical protein [Clostridia bacterium]